MLVGLTLREVALVPDTDLVWLLVLVVPAGATAAFVLVVRPRDPVGDRCSERSQPGH